MKYVDFDIPTHPLTDFKYAHMNLLLGGDVYPHIMLSASRKDSKNTLIAQQPIFGWVVTGKMPQSNSFPFRFESSTYLSDGPSRKDAISRNLRSNYYITPRLKPNKKDIIAEYISLDHTPIMTIFYFFPLQVYYLLHHVVLNPIAHLFPYASTRFRIFLYSHKMFCFVSSSQSYLTPLGEWHLNRSC